MRCALVPPSSIWLSLQLLSSTLLSLIGPHPVSATQRARKVTLSAFTYSGETWAAGSGRGRTRTHTALEVDTETLTATKWATVTVQRETVVYQTLTRTSMISALPASTRRKHRHKHKSKYKTKLKTVTQGVPSPTSAAQNFATATSTKSTRTKAAASQPTETAATSNGAWSNDGLTFPLPKNPQPDFTAAGAFSATVYVGTAKQLWFEGSCGLTNPDNVNKYPAYDKKLQPVAMPETVMQPTGWSNNWCGRVITIQADGSDGLSKISIQAVIASRNVYDRAQKAPSLDLSAELWEQMGGVAGHGCHSVRWRMDQ